MLSKLRIGAIALSLTWLISCNGNGLDMPLPHGLIVFESARDGNREIYVMNADGTGVARLTNHPESDGSPNWSPDGRQIVFTSSRTGDSEIYVMNADGSDVTRLTDNPRSDWLPDWSPDGRRIVFQRPVPRDGDWENGWDFAIYVMNADGSDMIRPRRSFWILLHHPYVVS